ncbi:MAG TPA: hypothetical protein VH280_02490 [Verrucomicrobiae bacterium]|nr:hypothetical protein [Verrucomicrobiae bacterium]
MKVFLAIAITVGLLIACYTVSALIYFDLALVLIGVSSTWAAWDAKRIGLYRYKSGLSGRPIVVFCLCYLFWVFMFPYYLWLRFKIKQGTAKFKDETATSARPLFRRATATLAEWALIGIVGFKISLLAFCVEECWRGQRTYENYRHEIEAKGQSLDWDAMIPPPVPDSQNFYSAPMMSVWFVQPSDKIKVTDDIAKRLNYGNPSEEVEIAEIKCIVPGTKPTAQTAPNLFRFNIPQSSGQVKKLIQNSIGPCAFGLQGQTLLARPLNTNQLKPPLILLESDRKLTANDLISLFMGGCSSAGPLTFRPEGANSWLVLTRTCPARDYLTWSEQFNSDFNLMREAAKRPYARIEGDYSFPPSMPIPNFVNIRAVSETLAQRAQCFLLLNQPDRALQEMSLLNALRAKLEGAPTGKPMSLVSAMINVAVAKLYADTVQDGLRLHAWKEPQLIKLEEQLAQMSLASPLKESFHEEEVSAVRIVEVLMRNLEVHHVPGASLWQNIIHLTPPNVARGFFYFNEMLIVRLDQNLYDCIDISNQTVLVSKVAGFQREDDELCHYRFWQLPYRFYALIVVPNYTKAAQTFAFAQTKVDQAQIVCALERYRAGHGDYPGTLNDLAPAYIGKLPHDIIGAQPLRYSKNRDRGFRLYSIGWNQLDDGGQSSSLVDQGDWVWQ